MVALHADANGLALALNDRSVIEPESLGVVVGARAHLHTSRDESRRSAARNTRRADGTGWATGSRAYVGALRRELEVDSTLAVVLPETVEFVPEPFRCLITRRVQRELMLRNLSLHSLCRHRRCLLQHSFGRHASTRRETNSRQAGCRQARARQHAAPEAQCSGEDDSRACSAQPTPSPRRQERAPMWPRLSLQSLPFSAASCARCGDSGQVTYSVQAYVIQGARGDGEDSAAVPDYERLNLRSPARRATRYN